MATWLELEPSSNRSLDSDPTRKFDVVTRETHGRVRITTDLPIPPAPRGPGHRPAPGEDLPALPSTSVRGRVQGLWRPERTVRARHREDRRRPRRTGADRTIGAGLDIANDALISALVSAAREAGQANDGVVQPRHRRPRRDNRVDFEAGFTLPAEAGDECEASFGVEARLDRLAIGGSQVLEDVSAHLRFVDASDDGSGRRCVVGSEARRS